MAEETEKSECLTDEEIKRLRREAKKSLQELAELLPMFPDFKKRANEK